MTGQEMIDYCLTHAGAVADRPFKEDDSIVVRHRTGRKWFALLMEVHGRQVLNLKCDPLKGEFWSAAYQAVTPAYHMNKMHWISVWLDECDVPDGDLHEMIDDSFSLTAEACRIS